MDGANCCGFFCITLTSCHSYLTISSFHQKQKKREQSRLQDVDSDNTFLTPSSSCGERDNGSGHLEINVPQFSSITHSDVHICRMSSFKLPTDPSACLDMMRGGV